MDYNERIAEIKRIIENKEYALAEEKLTDLISTAKIKNIVDENSTHYAFTNYIETLIFWNIYRPEKKNIHPDISYAQIYYYLGFINIEQKKYEKGLEYFKKGLEWDPVDVKLMFEIADVYGMLGNLERFKAEIEKAYSYIYDSSYMARYYSALGWYYIEKRVFDLANALCTQSIAFLDTELARNELAFIAKQVNKEVRFSTKEEIKKLFIDYNIWDGFNRNTVNFIYEEYKRLEASKPQPSVFQFLKQILYDITLDEQYYSDNIIITKINEEYAQNKISDNLVKMLHIFSHSVIKENKQDPFWTNTAKNILEMIILISLINNNNVSKENLIEQVRDINKIKITLKDNIEKLSIPELNEIMISKSIIDIDKTFGSVMEIIQEALIPNTISTEHNKKTPQAQPKLNKQITDKLKEYSQEIPNYPTFKFYFPESMGEYRKKTDKVFELRKDNIRKIRVMISKCSSADVLEEEAKKWIEKNKTNAKMEEVSYRKETINNIPIEVYELRKIGSNGTTKIYKIGYVNGCRITISGGNTKRKEEIINKAFETITWEEPIKNDGKNKIIEPKVENKSIIVDCSACNTSFELKWNVPATEKIFYCKCPNCGMELKKENPNYKE